ncbi:hypothetical protein [Kribbella monticola]|uniref:hypothetical protein n=1 Tax=Kribbella monticola TaxID=2185285 RepID=UPI000DD2E70E|nr:hypothetical protein [Kribbella monticola]
MRRRERRGEELATRANVVLIQCALASIRTTAYLRRDPGLFSGVVVDDYHELIRSLADTAASLPGSLRADTRQTPAEGLQYAWDSSNELMRRWIRETLASEGILLDDLVS